MTGSMKEGFSEERAFELALENTLDFTNHSRQREQLIKGLLRVKNTQVWRVVVCRWDLR